MALILETGDENAGQIISIPVPGRSSPLVVRPSSATPPLAVASQTQQFGGAVNNIAERFLAVWETQSNATAAVGGAQWGFTGAARTLAQLSVAVVTALAADEDFTFYAGATIGALGAQFSVILPAGLTKATFSIPVVIPADSYLALSCAGNLVASPNNVQAYLILL